MGAKRLSFPVTEQEFFKMIAEEVSEITGVQLENKQDSVVRSRLWRRILDLGYNSVNDYALYLEGNRHHEMKAIISLLTTHHTYFFREFSQFEFLLQTALPELVTDLRRQGRKVLRIWSAACSRGQEVYSLAMFLKQHLPAFGSDLTFEIIGTDVCEESVAIANNAVYRWDEIKEIPAIYLQSNWARGTGEIADFAKVKADLKKHCRFHVSNLLDFSGIKSGEKFDVIFCRNVFIYFTKDQVRKISENFLKHLSDRGFLYVGLSESLNDLQLPVDRVGPSVYRPLGGTDGSKEKVVPITRTTASMGGQTEAPTKNLRVVCVDDSPTILTILKKVLVAEHGFEVIGTAKNGIEAAQRIRELKPDLVTLDIHMPEQNGVAYLESNFSNQHPPVVMISSVSREDGELGFRALKLGASDYIEKPSLDNLQEKGDEIRTKLRCALAARKSRSTAANDVDQAFRKNHKFTSVDGMLRVVLGGGGGVMAMLSTLKTLEGEQPPVIVGIENGVNLMDTIKAQSVGSRLPFIVPVSGSTEPLKKNTIYLMSFEDAVRRAREAGGGSRISVLTAGQISRKSAAEVGMLSGVYLIVEDLGAEMNVQNPLRSKAQQVVPISSFIYESDKFLSGGGR